MKTTVAALFGAMALTVPAAAQDSLAASLAHAGVPPPAYAPSAGLPEGMTMKAPYFNIQQSNGNCLILMYLECSNGSLAPTSIPMSLPDGNFNFLSKPIPFGEGEEWCKKQRPDAAAVTAYVSANNIRCVGAPNRNLPTR